MSEREGHHWRRREWPSAAQRRVLDVLLDRRTNAQISALLGLSFETVKWHVSELLAEPGLASALVHIDGVRWVDSGGAQGVYSKHLLYAPDGTHITGAVAQVVGDNIVGDLITRDPTLEEAYLSIVRESAG